MRLDNDSDELARPAVHAGTAQRPGMSALLPVRFFDSNHMEYEAIYHREDGSERIGGPWPLPIGHFIERTFGRWYDGSSPPLVIVRAPCGQPVPMDPRKIGVGRPAPDGAAHVNDE